MDGKLPNGHTLIDGKHFYRATAYNATHGISKPFLSVHLPVCLSVCLSKAWICDKTKETCAL